MATLGLKAVTWCVGSYRVPEIVYEATWKSWSGLCPICGKEVCRLNDGRIRFHKPAPMPIRIEIVNECC